MKKPIFLTVIKGFFALLAVALFFVPGLAFAENVSSDEAPGRTMALQATRSDGPWTTADHGKFEALKGQFTQGKQITEACLSCHSEADSQFHKTIHWTWTASENENGNPMGKAQYSSNNFCLSTNKGADKGCMSCHPGWGKETEAVNCLVCHGQKDINWTEAFEDRNFFLEEGDPESLEIAAGILTDIQAAAQSIGRPGRKNCGSCHFYGGGGDGVKHGDLDTSLIKPNKALDVHMGTDGQNFDCVRCHTTKFHDIAGRIYTAPAYTERKSLIEDDLTSKITCESCHGDTPHLSGSKANDHTDKVACQSCHIPSFARVNPTKMSWDWSKAGKTREGKPYTTDDEFGRHDYMSIKGQMRWDKDVKPSYFWFNGSIKSFTAADTIDPSGTVPLSHPVGGPEDEISRIYPFKVHKGVQPYDKINKTLLAPLLSGPEGYWNSLDWQKALTAGSKAIGLPYSGEYDFVESTYVFPTTHMVAPKENAVACTECHSREDKSRLAGVPGVYMPSRDRAAPLDTVGWLVVLGALVGVCLHGLGRVFTSGKRKGE